MGLSFAGGGMPKKGKWAGGFWSLPAKARRVKVDFMKRIVFLWALLLGFLPLARSQVIAVSAELSVPDNQVLADEKMLVKMTIQNRSGQDLKLGTGSDWLTFTVLGEKNSLVPPIGTNHVYIEGETNVPAGLSASREFNLTPYFDFRQPGHYTVKAAIKIAQWGQEIAAQPATFTVISGVRLMNLPGTDVPVGVQLLPSQSNQPPEARRYYLEKKETMSGMSLYVRLTDVSGGRTLRLVSLGPYFSFSEPDVKLDRFNNLHVLHQTDAKAFTYCVIDTLGQILERQTYQYTNERPALRADAEGGVRVAGGARVVSANDLPPPQKAEPPVTPAPASFPGSRPGNGK